MSKDKINSMDYRTGILRQYRTIPDVEDIMVKVFDHGTNLLKCSKFMGNNIFINLSEALISVCHKLCTVRYHMLRYKTIEASIHELLLKPNELEQGIDKYLIDETTLTAEYEAFLFQTKASLDFLMVFINKIYEGKCKQLNSFSDGGKGVLKALKKFVQHCPKEHKYLAELIAYLEAECPEKDEHPNGNVPWFILLKKLRDKITHYGREFNFAFQINVDNKATTIRPPRATENQSLFQAMEVIHENLIVFVQDFLSLLLRPYLRKEFIALCFRPEAVIEGAPKWYVSLAPFQIIFEAAAFQKDIAHLLQQSMDFYAMASEPMTAGECQAMHFSYFSYLRNLSERHREMFRKMTNLNTEKIVGIAINDSKTWLPAS